MKQASVFFFFFETMLSAVLRGERTVPCTMRIWGVIGKFIAAVVIVCLFCCF